MVLINILSVFPIYYSLPPTTKNLAHKVFVEKPQRKKSVKIFTSEKINEILLLSNGIFPITKELKLRIST